MVNLLRILRMMIKYYPSFLSHLILIAQQRNKRRRMMKVEWWNKK
jgi:hypothetical protein